METAAAVALGHWEDVVAVELVETTGGRAQAVQEMVVMVWAARAEVATVAEVEVKVAAEVTARVKAAMAAAAEEMVTMVETVAMVVLVATAPAKEALVEVAKVTAVMMVLIRQRQQQLSRGPQGGRRRASAPTCAIQDSVRQSAW